MMQYGALLLVLTLAIAACTKKKETTQSSTPGSGEASTNTNPESGDSTSSSSPSGNSFTSGILDFFGASTKKESSATGDSGTSTGTPEPVFKSDEELKEYRQKKANEAEEAQQKAIDLEIARPENKGSSVLLQRRAAKARAERERQRKLGLE